MTSIEDLKMYLNAVIRSNQDRTDRQAGRRETAQGVLDFIAITGMGTVPEEPVEVDHPVRVVEVNSKYHYLLPVGDVGDAKDGDKVLVESRNGGEWTGTVTAVYRNLVDFREDTGSPASDDPTLTVLEVL